MTIKLEGSCYVCKRQGRDEPTSRVSTRNGNWVHDHRPADKHPAQPAGVVKQI